MPQHHTTTPLSTHTTLHSTHNKLHMSPRMGQTQALLLLLICFLTLISVLIVKPHHFAIVQFVDITTLFSLLVLAALQVSTSAYITLGLHVSSSMWMTLSVMTGVCVFLPPVCMVTVLGFCIVRHSKSSHMALPPPCTALELVHNQSCMQCGSVGIISPVSQVVCLHCDFGPLDNHKLGQLNQITCELCGDDVGVAGVVCADSCVALA
mmetsp:Transcript_5863/g.12918  ORF Transcript_5863/g.12918 Transcript_5863/m.12918 type:complete len:208 (-) Transcript_5863:65-688(-)